MAKSKAKRDAETSESEEEYEVDKIKKHEVKKGQLYYRVSWKGYPDEEWDTDEPESGLGNASLKVKDYWKALAGTKQAGDQKYSKLAPPGSTVKVSSKRRQSEESNPTPSSKKSKTATSSAAKTNGRGRPRSSTPVKKPTSAKREPEKVEESEFDPESKADSEEDNEDEEVEDELVEKTKMSARAHPKRKGKVQPAKAEEASDDEEEVAPKATRNNRRASSSPKRVQKPDLKDMEDPTEAAADEVEEGYTSGRKEVDWHLGRYKYLKTLEDKIFEVDTIQRDEETQKLKVMAIWAEDHSKMSWIYSDIYYEKLPKHVIRFFEEHLNFKRTDE